MSVDEKQGHRDSTVDIDIDFATFHEKNAGRLVIDPAYVVLFLLCIPHLTCFIQRSRSRIR